MTCALELDDVSVEVAGRTLLSHVRFRTEPGELVALLGRNGAGKSTLLKVALGLVRTCAGEVRIGGRPVGKLSGRERAARIAWLPQHVLVHEALTAVELVAAARFRFDETRASAIAAARRALSRAGAVELAARVVTSLSGGERQRAALAVLLAQEAPLLLMDEPASHLDPAQQIATYRLIGELWRGGQGIVCVTHDPNLLHHALAGDEPDRVRVVGLEAGSILFEHRFGDPALAGSLSQMFGVRIAKLRCEGTQFFAPLAEEPGAAREHDRR
ncbi:MAG TPA: ABC transporter ATP-binding protein [Kofleriaceae bacterium]|nr:ABC transporter ATP-binding protein [Kofleriaceae bacterium]